MKKNLLLITLLVLIPTFVAAFFTLKTYKIFNVATGSMESALPKDSIIFVKPARQAETLKKNDIISYKYNGLNTHVVTHRIVDVQEYGDSRHYTLKGDANEFKDSLPVSEDEIIGKVAFTIPCAGKIITLLLNPWVLGALFYAPIGFLFGRKFRELFVLLIFLYLK